MSMEINLTKRNKEKTHEFTNSTEATTDVAHRQ